MLIFSNNEARLIERVYEGENQAFTTLYEKFRAMFYRYFNNKYSMEKSIGNSRCRFMDGNLYLDDLYQTSCLKLYNQIITNKLFVRDNKIYIRDKKDNINILSAKLGTYLTSIGEFTFKEMQRGERRYVDFDPFENIFQDDGFIAPTNVNIDPLYDMYADHYFDDENIFAIVRRIVEEMASPCKEIFTYTYFSEDGKRMKGEDIALKMGYASADVVKNQKSRCHKKFKEKYMDLLKSN